MTGPSFTSSTCMSAPNRPVATLAPRPRSSATNALDQGFRHVGGGGIGPRRPAPAAGVGVQRELADHEHGAAHVGHREVHHTFGVGEHAQPPDLVGELGCRRPVVGVGDAHEHAQPRSDVADDLAVDGHPGPRDPLDQRLRMGPSVPDRLPGCTTTVSMVLR